MNVQRVAATVVAVACLALTGCGGDGASTGGGVTTSEPPSSSSVSPGSTGTPKPPQTPPVAGTKPGGPNTATPFPGETTLRGTVAEGVELGCMVLRAEDGNEYLLLGGDRSVISAGKRLEVVGRSQPGLMTTCQQGIPFKVSQARPI